MTLSQARTYLPHLVDVVQAGEDVTITRHGQPVAVIVRPDTLTRRRGSSVWDQAERIGRQLEQYRAEPLSAGHLSSHRADDLVRSMRDERDQR